MTNKPIHEQWSSRSSYILAATGSAVGLGNIWKFPYITGENGGGAFVLVYLACIVVIGLPILIAETMLGKRGQCCPVNTIGTLTRQAGADGRWKYLGWMGTLAGMLILAYYSVIAGWVLAYVLKAIFGGFSGDAGVVSRSFDDLIASPVQLFFWHSVFVVATMSIVVRGVKGGMEKAVRWLMPCLFVLLLILLAFAMDTGRFFADGLAFLFQPDFSKLSVHSLLVAMGQAFFTLSLGMGAMMAYGAYLPKGVSIVKTSLYIAAADTIVALLAGMIIFPLVFAGGLEITEGPGLIFKTLPIAFGNMTGGWLLGVLFFTLLVAAALTSSIALVEPAVAWLTENHNCSRFRAGVIVGFVVWLLGVSVAFSFNIWADVRIFGASIFGFLDYITANIMLPIGGFGIAIFVGRVMHRRQVMEEIDLSPKHYQIWEYLLRRVAPVAVAIVFIANLGLF